MKNNVAFISPSSTSGHAVRGIGFYVKNLLTELKRQASKFDIAITETSEPNSKYTIVHYPYLDLFSRSLPLNQPTKTVVTIHDLIPLEYPDVYQPGVKGKINYQLQKFALQSVDRILTDSLASAKAIHSYLGIPHEKIKVIYLAAHDRFKPVTNTKLLIAIQKKYSLPKKFVLYMGDINYSKNINFLIEACIASNIPLCLGGKNITEINGLDLSHPELRHLQKTKTYLTNPLIKLLGFIPDEDLPAIYTLATLYCQPSFAEGFGIPVLEAMACGTPVLVSRTGALTEVVGPDLASYQFDPKNPQEFSSLLNRAWTDTVFRKHNAIAGLKRSKSFSWAKAAEQTLLSYQELL